MSTLKTFKQYFHIMYIKVTENKMRQTIYSSLYCFRFSDHYSPSPRGLVLCLPPSSSPLPHCPAVVPATPPLLPHHCCHLPARCCWSRACSLVSRSPVPSRGQEMFAWKPRSWPCGTSSCPATNLLLRQKTITNV